MFTRYFKLNCIATKLLCCNIHTYIYILKFSRNVKSKWVYESFEVQCVRHNIEGCVRAKVGNGRVIYIERVYKQYEYAGKIDEIEVEIDGFLSCYKFGKNVLSKLLASCDH
jgi:hypothetical protein